AVHLLRTSCRRMDAILAAAPDGGGGRKLRRRLRSLRRAAGKVRDLDVQLKALAGVRLQSVADEQRRLARRLQEKRARQERKLRKTVAAQTAKLSRQLHRFLQRQAPAAALPIAGEKLLRSALDEFSAALREHRGS